MAISEYQRTSNISRQFTDEEAAIDGRISAMSETPAVTVGAPATMSETYKVMREEIRMRAEMNAVLGQEQQMAYTQSARRELARQAEDSQRDEEESVVLVNRMNDMVAGGMDFEDARDSLYKEDPSRAMRPAINAAFMEYEKVTQSPEERQARKTKSLLDKYTSQANLSNAMGTAALADVQNKGTVLDDRIETAKNTAAAAAIRSQASVSNATVEASNAKMEEDFLMANPESRLKMFTDTFTKGVTDASIANTQSQAKLGNLGLTLENERNAIKLANIMSQADLENVALTLAKDKQDLISAVEDGKFKEAMRPQLQNIERMQTFVNHEQYKRAVEQIGANKKDLYSFTDHHVANSSKLDGLPPSEKFMQMFDNDPSMFMDVGFWEKGGKIEGKDASATQMRAQFVDAMNTLVNPSKTDEEKIVAQGIVNRRRGEWLATGTKMPTGPQVPGKGTARDAKGQPVSPILQTAIPSIYEGLSEFNTLNSKIPKDSTSLDQAEKMHGNMVAYLSNMQAKFYQDPGLMEITEYHLNEIQKPYYRNSISPDSSLDPEKEEYKTDLAKKKAAANQNISDMQARIQNYIKDVKAYVGNDLDIETWKKGIMDKETGKEIRDRELAKIPKGASSDTSTTEKDVVKPSGLPASSYPPKQ